MSEKPTVAVSSEDEVLDINNAFYRALQTLDLDAMDRVWLHKDWVFCTHPGWQGITGWGEIRDSWESIFASTRQMRIELHQVAMQLCGPVAWVTCIEEITSDAGNGLSASLAQATNIFLKVGEDWKLVHHHTSPVPVMANFPETERIQ